MKKSIRSINPGFMPSSVEAPKDVEIYQSFAVALAKKAGFFLYKNFGNVKKIEEKKFKENVTDIDKKSEGIIISAIRKKFPNHDILSEEKGSIGKKSDYLWVIDPLDGTHNYIARIPIYGVSISLCFREKPIAGAIYLPHVKEMYEAGIKKGAYLNKKRIRVSDVESLKDSFILTETGCNIKLEEKIRNLRFIAKEAGRIRVLGSLVFQLSYLASGRIEGVVSETGRPWDYAAGSLLVKEAGGKVTDFKGGESTIRKEYMIATNGKIHNQLLKLLSNK